MRTLAVSLLLFGFASPVLAVPVVDMVWNGCSGPVDRTVVTGDKPELYLSVLGQSQTTLGYTIKLRLSPAVAPYPDAWRFDPSGCKPFGSLQSGQDPPPAWAPTCPPLHGTVPSTRGQTFTFDGPTQTASIRYDIGYPGTLGQGNPAATNPSQRYFLLIVRFDMTNSVPGAAPAGSCGGLEKPMCITITSAQWGDPPGVLHDWALGSASVTANDPTNTSNCPGIGPTPAQASTWGAIKSQYRL